MKENEGVVKWKPPKKNTLEELVSIFHYGLRETKSNCSILKEKCNNYDAKEIMVLWYCKLNESEIGYHIKNMLTIISKQNYFNTSI